MKKWEHRAGGNEILQCDGFYISYLDPTNQVESCRELDSIANSFAELFGMERQERTEETALNDGECFRILKGDFRKEYEKIADKGLEACIKFYESKRKKYRSDWSTDDKLKDKA